MVYNGSTEQPKGTLQSEVHQGESTMFDVFLYSLFTLWLKYIKKIEIKYKKEEEKKRNVGEGE